MVSINFLWKFEHFDVHIIYLCSCSEQKGQTIMKGISGLSMVHNNKRSWTDSWSYSKENINCEHSTYNLVVCSRKLVYIRNGKKGYRRTGCLLLTMLSALYTHRYVHNHSAKFPSFDHTLPFWYIHFVWAQDIHTHTVKKYVGNLNMYWVMSLIQDPHILDIW